MPTLNQLKPAVQQQIVWLHHKAFGADDVPCKPCGGGCCQSCSYTEGYLHYIVPKPQLDKLKNQYNFDPPKPSVDGCSLQPGRGFLTDTGCALPLHLRSATCLGFICHDRGSHRGGRLWTKEEQAAAFQIQVLVHDSQNRKGAR